MKKTVKILLKYSVLVLLIAYLAISITWAGVQAEKDVCKNVEVRILNADSTVFLTQKGILKELEGLHIKLKGKRISEINTEAVEQALDKFDYLEQAECVIEDNSKVVIEVKQLLPIMRVFDGEKTYYLNKDGKQMRADARYHIDVPLVKGRFNNKLKASSLIPMVQYISGNEALNMLVTMIEVRDANNVFIIPNIYGHVVNIGTPTDFESKFAKLMMMYKDVMPIKGWYTYDTISVKWDYQIVATKRQKAIKEDEVFGPDDDEPAPDIETMTIEPDKSLGVAIKLVEEKVEKIEKKVEEKDNKSKSKKKDKNVKPKETKKETKKDAKETKAKKDVKDAFKKKHSEVESTKKKN
ncbi:MAG: hypothetical protein RRY02_00755 [Muribaculaceae bacterium]